MPAWSRLKRAVIWLSIFLVDLTFDTAPDDKAYSANTGIEAHNFTRWISTESSSVEMAAIYESEMGFHHGEEEMHKLLKVPHRDNPTSMFLTPFAANLLMRSPLIALGTIDAEGRPWTTLWGGEPGFARPVAQSVIGMKTTIDRTFDPVTQVLFAGSADGEVVKHENGTGTMVGGLAIDLETRKRVKLYGRMMAGALASTESGIGEVQLVVNIEQSLGNCPKYLNKKHITPHIPKPELVTATLPLPQDALDLITKCDLFFLSSSNHEFDMDTNHRGGPPGFVRIASHDEKSLVIVYPEYSGNRLYQTLGNLLETPQAGLVFPDFDNGNVLYVTGKTEILTGQAASNVLSHTNLAVKITVEALRFVSDGLGFRGELGERSPYNPPVRFLSTEDRIALSSAATTRAKLVSRDMLSATVARFRFQLSDPRTNWKAGQYVALSFQDELDIGYSHMRDDDPKSLNDDYLRTFTVSSRPGDTRQFEITIRKVGPVTEHLFKHNMRFDMEVPIMGFGGEFYIQQSNGENVAFVAGGVGITPLLAQAHDLDLQSLRLYWTVKVADLALVSDTFNRIPGLAAVTKLFVTGKIVEPPSIWKSIEESGATLHSGRMTQEDFQGDLTRKWYLCTGVGLRNSILSWLTGKGEVFYEDFNY